MEAYMSLMLIIIAFAASNDGIMYDSCWHWRSGYSGDGGPATLATLHQAELLWHSDLMAVFMLLTSTASSDRRVGPDSMITTVAGKLARVMLEMGRR